MTYRVLLRMSLNGDGSSMVRNHIASILEEHGLEKKKGTATWEGHKLAAEALNEVAHVLTVLANPGPQVRDAADGVELDHLWLYVDRDD